MRTTWRVSPRCSRNACSGPMRTARPPVLWPGGRVQAQDAVTYLPFTTLDGVVDCASRPGDPEFDVPARLLELHAAKDFGPYGVRRAPMPVCFTASLHTTGGNPEARC